MTMTSNSGSYYVSFYVIYFDFISNLKSVKRKHPPLLVSQPGRNVLTSVTGMLKYFIGNYKVRVDIFLYTGG